MKVLKPRIKCENKVVIEAIAKENKVSRNCVYQALSFFNNSSKGREIRKRALSQGAVLISEEVMV